MWSRSAVRTARPATRPAYSFFKFRAHPLNVLPSGFRFLDGDNPANPLIAREWRNILPFCPRRRIRAENFSQIRRHTVDRASGDHFLGHEFDSTRKIATSLSREVFVSAAMTSQHSVGDVEACAYTSTEFRSNCEIG